VHWFGRLCKPGVTGSSPVSGFGFSTRKLWKTELQRLADATGLTIQVCHLPPGTSKWHRIEHRPVRFISRNWRGRPLVSLEVIINLITASKTRTGREVYAQLDT
jgi:hypothetical protein